MASHSTPVARGRNHGSLIRSDIAEFSSQKWPVCISGPYAIAIDYFKEMLSRYRPGDRVGEDDSLDLAALLERHPEYTAKVGCGVDHFEVFKTEHGTQCFRIVRVNSTPTDFSYRKCISGRPPSRKQEVSAAFRQVIKFDLYAARDRFLASHTDKEGCFTCAVTGERIGRNEAHIDHLPPMTFEVIVTTFLVSKGLSPDDVTLTTGQDNQVAPIVNDPDLREDFRKHHKRLARLDFVKSNINLAQASRNRLRSGRVNLRSDPAE